MKVLLVYADMVRPGLLNTFNPAAKEGEIDRKFREWGGTVYTNCFTPAPDTPRSSGCLWSSNYPSVNGCTTRSKYPRYFLKKPEDNFLSVLQNEGYKLNLFVNAPCVKIGCLPVDLPGCCIDTNKAPLAELLEGFVPEENSLTYFYLTDYHQAVSDWYAVPKAHEIGDKMIGGALSVIEEALPINQFDLAIVFSDHGWKKSNDKNDTLLEWINRDRDQILMYVRQKGDRGIKRDDRLCSIMDIGPTVCDAVGTHLPYDTEGRSLFSGAEPSYIVVEDHHTVGVQIELPLDVWGIRTTKGLSCVDAENHWYSEIPLSKEMQDEYEKIIEQTGTSFRERLYGQMILNLYQESNNSAQYNGQKRKEHPPFKRRLLQCVATLLLPLFKILKRIVIEQEELKSKNKNK